MASALQDVLDELMLDHGLRVEEVASRAEVGVSTAKLVLKKLLEEQRVERVLMRSGGRGRPAWYYTRCADDDG